MKDYRTRYDRKHNPDLSVVKGLGLCGWVPGAKMSTLDSLGLFSILFVNRRDDANHAVGFP